MSSTGTVSTDFNFNTTNLKLGIKTSGTFYFRFEVGFGLLSQIKALSSQIRNLICRKPIKIFDPKIREFG